MKATRAPLLATLAASLALLLVACAPNAPRVAAPTASVIEAAPLPAPEPASKPAPPAASAADADPPWSRLRQQFQMQRCDYRPQVQHWLRAYTRSPRHFQASWEAALPFVQLVTDEVVARNLPGEFAMLPFVESDYQPLAPRGNGAGGMWQFMPATARLQGLAVGRDYDARLDALASTRAALDLIGIYYEKFGDWRLADLAYNAGEFRVRKLLGERDGSTLNADDLGQLRLDKVSHDHLDRLLALACIIEDPARFGLKLPQASAATRLVALELDAPLDLRIAARLAGLPTDAVRRWNAAYRHDRMAAAAPLRLLLPQDRVERFEAALPAIPAELRNDWHEEVAGRSGRLDAWASTAGIPAEALAAANALAVDASVSHRTRLLLPGREMQRSARTRASTGDGGAIHVVAAGDTLWSIARRHDLSLHRLRELNPHALGTLRIGMRLRLADDAATVDAAAPGEALPTRAGASP